MPKSVDEMRAYIQAGKLGKHISPNIEMVLLGSNVDFTLKVIQVYIRKQINVADQDMINSLVFKALNDAHVHSEVWRSLRRMIPGFDFVKKGQSAGDLITEFERMAGPPVGDYEPLAYRIPRVNRNGRRVEASAQFFIKDVESAEREINSLRVRHQSAAYRAQRLTEIATEAARAAGRHDVVAALADPARPIDAIHSMVQAPTMQEAG